MPGKDGAWRHLAARIAASIAPIEIQSSLHGLVHSGTWDRVEVLNQLRHLEVMIGAPEVLGDRWRATYCAPTQQSETAGHRFADVEGEPDVGARSPSKIARALEVKPADLIA